MNKKNVEILQVLIDEKTKDAKYLRIIPLTAFQMKKICEFLSTQATGRT